MADFPSISVLRARIAAYGEDDFRRDIHIADLVRKLGDAKTAKARCAAFIETHCEQIAKEGVLFDAIVNTAFRTGAHDALARYIAAIYGISITIGFEDAGRGYDVTGIIRWAVSADGSARFTFQENICEHDFHEVILTHWAQDFPLFAYYQTLPDVVAGEVCLSVEDLGSVPGLMYCGRAEPGFHLIPDPFFIKSDGYAEDKRTYAAGIPWRERRKTAYWRGSTTGWHDCRGNALKSWRDLPRVHLCELARSDAGAALLDVGITAIAQFDDEAVVAEITSSGLMKPPVHPREFQGHKLQIDIDGNTNSWPGLFTKLASGSPVLKVASPTGFRQWFYDRLVPWHNFVPVAADMSDLLDKAAWLLAHDEAAEEIGRHGRLLVDAMTVRGEIVLAGRTLREAFLTAPAVPW